MFSSGSVRAFLNTGLPLAPSSATVYSAEGWFLKAVHPRNAYPVTLVSFLTGFGRRCDSLFHLVAGKSLWISPVNLVAQRKIQ